LDGSGAAVAFTEIPAEIVGVEPVSLDSDFFAGPGAGNLMTADFGPRVRKRTDLPPVSMKDIYRHSTIRSLVSVLRDASPPAAEWTGSPGVQAGNRARELREQTAVLRVGPGRDDHRSTALVGGR
jgi:hypothetical protein